MTTRTYTATFSDGTTIRDRTIAGEPPFTHAYRVTGVGDHGDPKDYRGFAASLALAKRYAESWAQYVRHPTSEIVEAA